MFEKANERVSAARLIAAFLTSLCVRMVLFCLATISANRGCLKVPGEGFASAGFEGVEGAVVGDGIARATDVAVVAIVSRTEGDRTVVDMAMIGGGTAVLLKSSDGSRA